jgi:Protein of unknown function (DUF2924)
MPRSDVCQEPVARSKTVNSTAIVCSEGMDDMSLAQLRKLWHQRMGRKDPPRIRSLLLRELAWHDQQAVQGGMDAQTRALLRSAITQAQNTPIHPRPRNVRQQRLRTKPDLPPGTKLIRTWRGRKHEVVVQEGGKGFEYNGETFRGLTAIAEKITGAHWSGPRFFGLNRVRSV